MTQAPTPDLRRYLSSVGSTEEIIRHRYQVYAEMFAPGTCVVDVACGSGSFLDLLTQRGIEAHGVDSDTEFVAQAQVKGRATEVADPIGFLHSHPEEFDGVFAPNLVERLPAAQAIELIRAGARALRRRGRLVVVTRNPQNLSVQLSQAATDLQHVRFYSAEILRWLLHQAGLSEVDSGDNTTVRQGPTVSASPPSLGARTPTVQREALTLRLRARLRQRLAEWLQPASLLERVQDGEDRTAALERQNEVLASEVASLKVLSGGFFPYGEIYVTGVRE